MGRRGDALAPMLCTGAATSMFESALSSLFTEGELWDETSATGPRGAATRDSAMTAETDCASTLSFSVEAGSGCFVVVACFILLVDDGEDRALNCDRSADAETLLGIGGVCGGLPDRLS